MGGGLMQLVAYGAQDVYLTGNPQITFFKVVYRRHTNFSMEAIQQTINGSAGGTGSGTVTVSRNGDLLHKVYVVNSQTTVAIGDGQSIFDVVELEIGGQLIDRQNWLWREIYLELTTPESKARGVQAMTHSGANLPTRNLLQNTGDIVVPLHFWFCNNPGLALPLIALQYHEVKIKFNWNDALATNNQVWCDYIYLDTDERRRFAQVSHEYLIEQVQMQGVTESQTQRLNFNHPVKELIWTSPAPNAYGTARLTLNGHDRFAARNEEYFQLTQPLQHHTAVPGTNIEVLGRAELVNGSALTLSAAALTVELAPNAVSDVDGAGEYAIDITAGTERLNGTTTTAGTAHLAIHSDPAPGILAGDCLLLVSYEDAAGAGTVLSEVVTVAALDNASVTDRYAYRFTRDLQVIPATTAATGNLTISLIGRKQSPLARCSAITRKINCYSFALKPEEHQPSGTCNFSRIDTARLETGANLAAGDHQIYAVNYNVLRIMSGMGGLAYSN
jgi:hypothetical protein